MNIIWTSNNLPIESLGFGIVYPGTISTEQSIEIRSSAITDGTFQTLYNLSLFLYGDLADLDVIQNQWPAAGGGIDISFDRGTTFTRFTSSVGWAASPSSYILIPSTAFGFSSVDGVLAPTDSARILVRLTAPTSANVFSSYDIAFDASYDIV